MEPPEYEIDAVHFCVSSDDDIRGTSVLQITTSDLYVKDGAGKQVIACGGLLDARLGICGGRTGNKRRCETCQQTADKCTGHWGHIELHEPVYNINYLDILSRVLNSVCFFCGTVYASTEEELLQLDEEQRLRFAVEYAKNNKYGCSVCYHASAKVMKSPNQRSKGFLSVVFAGEDDIPQGMENGVLYAKQALQVLKLITDESVKLLGLSQRVERMLFIAFPVPPVTIRPTSITNRQRRESDLTEKLLRIVKCNEKLGAANKHAIVYRKSMHDLQVVTNNYIMGDKPANNRFMSMQDRKPAVESLNLGQRLKGKGGRMRGNLMGKRVDFSARTVVGPDPSLATDEIGISLKTAKALTFPERVTEHNIGKMYELIRTGPHSYPGCNYVIRPDGKLDLRICGDDIRLQLGDIVERHLVDGDIVLVNRAPSLHKMSIMGHYVRVDKSGTTKNMRLNLAVCTPYNADFDGDEMNIHVPQTQEARAEIESIGMVRNHIIDPKTCGPIMNLIQDAMLGVSKLSHSDVRVRFSRVCNILCKLKSMKEMPPNWSKRDWTGRELLSMAIPSGIYMFKEGDERDREEDIVIKNGQLLSGVLRSSHINGRNGLTKIIFKELGPQITVDFLTNVQFIANGWLEEEGFSIGMSDILLSKETYERIENFKIQEEQKIQESSENIINKLNKMRDGCGPFVEKECKVGNHIAEAVIAGSKGKYINLYQLCACVGTQVNRGKTLEPDSNSGRTLPYYTAQDRSSASHGFIKSSYLDGLNRAELVVHLMTAREGLIDTAVSTSETGYIQRRLIKAMEDITVRYDGTVRRSNGAIIQPQYGYHGLDSIHVEVQHITLHTWEFEKLQQTHLWSDADKIPILLKEKQSILHMWKFGKTHYEQLKLWEYDIPAAFHVKRCLWEATARFPGGQQLSREAAVNGIIELAKRLSDHATVLHTDGSILLHQWLLIEFLSSKVLVKQRVTEAAFNWLMKQLEHHFIHSAITPGEAVGAIAAQSLGSNATQMTLNTFHNCGQKEMDITLGLPRTREIVNVKDTKEARIILKLKKDRPTDTDQKIQDFIMLVTRSSLSTLLVDCKLLHIDDEILEAEMYIQDDYLVLESDEYKDRLSAIVLRCHCDKSIIQMLSMRNVVARIETLLKDENYIVMATDDNDDELAVIHIRYLHPVTARGKVRQGKALKEKLKKAYEILRNPKTMLLPLGNQEEGEEVQAQLKDKQEIILGSREFGNELLLLRHTEPLKSYCNDFKKVAEVLGVEAAKEVLRREATKIFSFQSSILPCHINLFVDVVTYTGSLLGVTRTGVMKHQTVGPLQQSTFEVTTTVLRNAAASCSTDHILGVSERIMLGRQPTVGTHMDMDLIHKPSSPEIPIFDIPSPTYFLNDEDVSSSYCYNNNGEEEEEQNDVDFGALFDAFNGTYVPNPEAIMNQC